MGRYAISDIHGCYNRMMDALERAGFNPSCDILYSLGDLCDRGDSHVAVLDYLSSLPNFTGIFGNHDVWLHDYLVAWRDGGREYARLSHHPIWDRNGGGVTMDDIDRRMEKNGAEEWLERMIAFTGSFRYMVRTGSWRLIHTPPSSLFLSCIGSISLPLEEITLETAFSSGLLLTHGYDSNVFSREIRPLYLHDKEGIWSDEDERELRESAYDTTVETVCGHTPMRDVRTYSYSERLNLHMIDGGSFVGVAHSSSSYGWERDGCITVMDLDRGELYFSN